MALNLFYKLDKDKNVVPATMEEANELLFSDSRIVKQETINDKFISTVFTCTNYNWDFLNKCLLPLVFETMVRDEGIDEWTNYKERYTTYNESLEGHERAVQWVKDGCKEEEIQMSNAIGFTQIGIMFYILAKMNKVDNQNYDAFIFKSLGVIFFLLAILSNIFN